MGKFVDRRGQKYGRLTPIEVVGKNKHGQMVWKCKCDCGNVVNVASNLLGRGNTKSCGCLNDDVRKSGNNRRKHGGCGTRLYRIWQGMHRRCYNPNTADYKNYRNISVCDDWLHDFARFRDWALNNGYDDTLSIDRIDPNGDYCPDNCRWADDKTQANNKTNNHIITIDGQQYSVEAACRHYHISKPLFYKRKREGMSDIEALMAPMKKRGGWS